MKRSRIVITGTRGIPNVMGGVETHCEELCPRLAAEGIDVTVIRRRNYIKGNPPMTAWRGVALVDISAPKSKKFEAIVHTFRAINMAKRLKADILHIHTIGPCLLAPYARLLGLKVVMTHHGPDYDRDKWGRTAKMMLRLGEWLGCRFANHVIVISDVIRQLVKHKYRREQNVTLIYNGVSKPEVCSLPEYFAELGIEEGKYILGMCRFVPEKNLHHLVEAFCRLQEDGKYGECKLVLAGDADFEDDYSRGLKDLARDKGVILTGFVKGKELHSLLTHTACYVLPSSHEGLPIALLEAMSYRVPVIASDIPANLEVDLPARCYFPCGDIAALCQRLKDVLCSAPSDVEYDMSKYDWNQIAKQVADVYRLVLSEKKSVMINDTSL